MNPLNLIRVMPALGTERLIVGFLAAGPQRNCDGEEGDLIGGVAGFDRSHGVLLRRRVVMIAALLCGLTQMHAEAAFAGGTVTAPDAGVSAGSGDLTNVPANTATGWVKTFAQAPIARGGAFEAPDYAGSLLESAGREEMKHRLAAMGFIESAESGEDLLTFSIDVEEPAPKAKGLPQSPIRLEGVDDDPTDNIHDPEIRPFIALPSGKKSSPAQPPSINVTIYARRGGERLWSGYAGAPMAGASREEIARSLVRSLIAHFGETANLPELPIEFAPDAAGPASN